jgi:hypothetical protein
MGYVILLAFEVKVSFSNVMLSLSSFNCPSSTLHIRIFRIFNSLSTSNILRIFGSVKSFQRELESYIHSAGHDVNSDSSSASGRSKKHHKRESKADSAAFPGGSYESGTLGDQTDDEASEIEMESKRSLDAVRIAFVRGEKISDEECAALEKVHLRRMALATEGGSSRGVSPIKRAYEALQENNRRKKSGVLGGSSDSTSGLDPLIKTALREEDPDRLDSSQFASSSSSSSSGRGRGRGSGSHQEKERIGGNVDRDREHREGGGKGMDYNMLDEFLNGYEDGPDAYAPKERNPKERGPIPLSKLLSVFRRCRGSYLPSYLSYLIFSSYSCGNRFHSYLDFLLRSYHNE